jgi:thiol-disulfide isomerase/thioredoxin
MGKASRSKRLSAREKIAVQREAARRAERRRRVMYTGGSVTVVLVVVAAFIVAKALSSSTPAAATVRGNTAASVMQKIASVPASTLAAVGAGSGQTNKPKAIGGSPLTAGGKPEVLYMGAEYCPYCAAERWAMAQALSRFGTFSWVGLIHSSSTDVYPSTPTLTFYKSSYTSKYLTFTPVEMQDVDKKPLQTPTSAQNALLSQYDRAPYTNSPGAIPFIDIANKYGLIGGSSYLPTSLKGLSWTQVATAMSSPSSPVAKQVLGAANMLTAAICKATNAQPSSVCTTPTITTLQGKL